MPKDPITLGQLLQYLTEDCEVIQIMDGGNWGAYAECRANSYLLNPFLDYKVRCLEAMGEDCIRVELLKPENNKDEA